MKLRVLLILFFSFTSVCFASDTTYFGVFESEQIIDLSRFKGKQLEEATEFAKNTKWTVIINESSLTIKYSYPSAEPDIMEYFIEGSHIVGINKINGENDYWPMYFKDKDTLFMTGRKFTRVKENK